MHGLAIFFPRKKEKSEKLPYPANFHIRIIGSASYIVHEVRSVREREREREREIRRETEVTSPLSHWNWRWVYTFPCQKFALGSECTLSLAKNFRFSLHTSHLTLLIVMWRWNSQWVLTFRCQKNSPSLFRLSQVARLFFPSKKWIKLIPKTIGNRKRDCAWGCARGINTTRENLQIEKHKSWRCSFQFAHRTDLCFATLQIFSGGVILRAQPHAQSLFLFPIVFGINPYYGVRLTRLTLVCEVIRYRLAQVRQNLKKKKTFRVGGPQSPFSISSSFILSFVLLPFFLYTKALASLTHKHTHVQMYTARHLKGWQTCSFLQEGHTFRKG